MRARSSGGRVEIGASELRRESSDWTSHLTASISLSIAEMAAVRDAGVCVMIRDRLCPDWRRVNRSESMDVCPSLDKELDEEKVEHRPNGTPTWKMSQPFVRETEGHVTLCRSRCGSGGLHSTWPALGDAPHHGVFVGSCTGRHMLRATPE